MKVLTDIKPALGCSGRPEGYKQVVLLFWNEARHLEFYKVNEVFVLVFS